MSNKKENVMLNYDKDSRDIKVLQEIGVPYHEMNGYSVIEGEEFILREYHTNRREQGYEVPEKYQPQEKTRKEKEINYQEKMMHDIEGERVDREVTGFPDPNMWYEDDELMIHPETKETIPIWKYEIEQWKEKRHQEYLEYCRGQAKGKRNKHSAMMLLELKLKKIAESEISRGERLQKAIWEREERMRKMNKALEKRKEERKEKEKYFENYTM